jgi:hypothetical protein
MSSNTLLMRLFFGRGNKKNSCVISTIVGIKARSMSLQVKKYRPGGLLERKSSKNKLNNTIMLGF